MGLKSRSVGSTWARWFPRVSSSRNATFLPRVASCMAADSAILVLPTPPFRECTRTTTGRFDDSGILDTPPGDIRAGASVDHALGLGPAQVHLSIHDEQILDEGIRVMLRHFFDEFLEHHDAPSPL